MKTTTVNKDQESRVVLRVRPNRLGLKSRVERIPSKLKTVNKAIKK